MSQSSMIGGGTGNTANQATNPASSSLFDAAASLAGASALQDLSAVLSAAQSLLDELNTAQASVTALIPTLGTLPTNVATAVSQAQAAATSATNSVSSCIAAITSCTNAEAIVAGSATSAAQSASSAAASAAQAAQAIQYATNAASSAATAASSANQAATSASAASGSASTASQAASTAQAAVTQAQAQATAAATSATAAAASASAAAASAASSGSSGGTATIPVTVDGNMAGNLTGISVLAPTTLDDGVLTFPAVKPFGVYSDGGLLVGATSLNFSGAGVEVAQAAVPPTIVQTVSCLSGGTASFPQPVTVGNYLCAMLNGDLGQPAFSGLPNLCYSGTGTQLAQAYGVVATSATSPVFTSAWPFVIFELTGVDRAFPIFGNPTGTNGQFDLSANFPGACTAIFIATSNNNYQANSAVGFSPPGTYKAADIYTIDGRAVGGFVAVSDTVPQGQQTIGWTDSTGLTYPHYAGLAFSGTLGAVADVTVPAPDIPVTINGSASSFTSVVITTGNAQASASVSAGVLTIALGP